MTSTTDRGHTIDAHPPATTGSENVPAPGTSARRIAFLTDNGHGLGHITRLMALARRLPPGYVSSFLTMSESFGLVRQLGFAAEYFPSARKLRCGRPAWDHLMLERLADQFETFRPSALVVDHVNPPVTLRALHAAHPDVAFIWCRRGLWRDDRAIDALRLHDVFDLVIEPMDVASPVDQGPTVRFRRQCYVDPVTFLSADELVDRRSARHALGLPVEGEVVLLQLSADDPAELHSLIASTRDAVRSIADILLFAPLHVLHAHALDPVDGVHMRPVYPVSRYLGAFDAAISTAGYNSFHELIMAAIPTLFVARDTDSLDHQSLRAEVAHLAGAALHVERLGTDDTRREIARLLDEGERARLRTAARVLYPGNGAADAVEAVVSLVEERLSPAESGAAS